MKSFLQKLKNNQRGNVIILTAAAMPLLIGSAGLATDTIQWALWKRQLQRAADSAAIAGVYDRLQSGTMATVTTAVAKDLEINQKTGIVLSGTPTISWPGDTGVMVKQVKVVLRLQRRLAFSSMFLQTDPTIAAAATAASVPGSEEFCVVALESTSAMGIQTSGNGAVETDCSWMTNSRSTTAAVAKGSSRVKADVLAAAGGITQSANFTVTRYDPYSPAINDPYANLAPDPADMNCATEIARVNGNMVTRTVALTEDSVMSNYFAVGGIGLTQTKNCFASISVGSNKPLTLPAGVYYIDAGNVNVQGTLLGNGVTIVLTNTSAAASGVTIGTVDANASGNMLITAPTSGKWAGMAIYQDRRATDVSTPGAGQMNSSAPNKINGNSNSGITGVLYFPNQQLTYNGNGASAFRCTQVVARRVQFSGTSDMKLTDKAGCVGTGVEPVEGGVRVRLVA